MRKGAGYKLFSRTSKNWLDTLNLPKTILAVNETLTEGHGHGHLLHPITSHLYKLQKCLNKPVDYHLTDGPPFANGDLHIGKAVNLLPDQLY